MEKYGSINNLLNALDNDNQVIIDKIIKEAEEYKTNKIQQAERDKTIKKRRLLDETNKKAEQIKKGFLSNLNVELKRIKLHKQEENISKVFNTIQKKIEQINQDKRYLKLLKKLISEVIEVLHEKEIELVFSKNDETLITNAFMEEIKQLFNDHHIPFDSEQIRFDKNIKNGVIGLVKHKHLIYNNTLNNKLHRLHNVMAYSIYHELFKEDE